MAVALKAFTQMVIDWGGSLTLSWPGTAAAGDLAVLFCQDGRRRPANTEGWSPVYGGNRTTAWSKRITAQDLAVSLQVRAELSGLLVLSGAAGLGSHREYAGVRVRSAGSGVLVFGEEPPPATAIPPTADRVGAAVPSPGYGTNQLWFLTAASSGYRGLSGTSDRADYQAWEVRPMAGPQVPVLVSPAAGTTADAALPVVFVWGHVSSAGLAQAKAQLRVRPWTSNGSGTWLYATGSGTVTTTATELAQSAQSVTVTAGQLSSNTLYEWQVRTYDSDWSAWSGVVQLTLRTKPTVDTVTVTSPAGSLMPLVEWTRTAGYGSAEAWQVRVSVAGAGSDSPLWDSLVRPGAGVAVQAPSTAPWVNGQQLVAWVRVMQSGGLWSAWSASSPFAVSWTPPAAPTSVSASDPAGQPLTVTVSGIAAGVTGLQLETSADGGESWRLVRTVPFPDASVDVRLPLAEYGAPLAVRARVWRTVDGVDLWSSWAQSAADAVSTWPGACLVTDDGAEWMSVIVERQGDQARELVQGIAVSYGLGADRPRVDRTAPAGERGTLVLVGITQADVDALVGWVTGRDVWRVRWGAQTEDGGLVRAGVTRMAQASTVTVTRIAGRSAARLVSFDWVEQ